MIPSAGEAKGSNAAAHVIRGDRSRILPPGRGPTGGRTSEAVDDAPVHARVSSAREPFDALFTRYVRVPRELSETCRKGGRRDRLSDRQGDRDRVSQRNGPPGEA